MSAGSTRWRCCWGSRSTSRSECPVRPFEELLQKSESSQRVLDEATEDFRHPAGAGRGRRRAKRFSPSTRSPRTRVRSSSWSTRRSVQRHSAPGERHPHRDRRNRGVDQVPHRRRPLPGDGRHRQASPPDHHQPHQGDGGARHLGEAHSPGRPLQAATQGSHHRLPCLHPADRAR